MDKLTQHLTQHIDTALSLWESITLKKLVEFYPITELAEIYAYLKIAYDHPRHNVTFREEIFIIKADDRAIERRVIMPTIIFHRQAALTLVPTEKLSFAVAFAMVTQSLQIETASLTA
jgi:hypothetical protein